MVTRVSGGKFLEVLASAPALDIPIEVDVFDGGSPATMLATLDGAFGKRFTRELNELGSGSFIINRADPKATAANLALGNLIKFGVRGVYRHAMWIEEPVTTVVSEREGEGEHVKISGRGALAYLERAVVYPPVWPLAAATVVATAVADNGSAGATSLTIAKPSGAAASDVCVIGMLSVGAAPATISGWRKIREVTNGTLRLTVYRKRFTSSEPGTTTWTWGTTVTRAIAASVALRNASDDDAEWAISDTTGSGTAIELPSVNVPLVDAVLLTLAGSASSTSITPGAGLTELVDSADTGRTIQLAALENPPLGDTGDLTATAGTSADWIGMQLMIPSTAVAYAEFTGATFGGVLATLIDEAKARGALPDLTYDFSATVDSHGEPWADVHDLSFHVGTTLLEVWRHLVTLGLEGGMTPDLRLQAFVDASRHFETTIIFRKGHQLLGDVQETAHGAGLRTRVLIEGAGGRIVEVIDPTPEAIPRIGRREGYLTLSTSDNATTLQRAGEASLEAAAAEDDARAIAVTHGSTGGHYEPWVDYREADWIGLDQDGSGGEAVPERVASITLEETDAGDYGVELELNSVEMDAFLRLQRRLDALSRETTASGSGGTGGTGVGPGRVGVTGPDSPGFLFDKIAAAPPLTKALGGVSGNQQVVLGVGTGTKDGTRFLRDDGEWSVPASPALTQQSAVVATAETTASTSYTNLATPGPSVTVDVGASGVLMVFWSCQQADVSLMSVELSGANTVAASDDWASYWSGVTDGQHSMFHLFSGLTPGSTTVTAKYRVTSGTRSYRRRNLTVLVL